MYKCVGDKTEEKRKLETAERMGISIPYLFKLLKGEIQM